MAKTPPDETPPALAGHGTVNEGVAQLDTLFPAAAPASDDTKTPEPKSKEPDPEHEEEATPEPSLERELDEILGLEPEAEPDAESGAEEEADPNAEDPDKTKDQPLYTVINEDGSEEKVTRKELHDRTLRRQDYTRKTQELAEERRKLDAARESEVGELGKVRERYIAELKELETALNQPEPDWEKVRRDAPDDYLTLREEWRSQQEAKRRVAEKRRSLEEDSRAEAEKKYNAHVRAEQERLVAAMPELKDSKTGSMLRDQMFEAGMKVYGFNEAELKGISDHRPWLVLRDAMRFRQILARRQELRQKAKPKNSKTLKPGSPRPKGAGKERVAREAVGRARDTGDAREAAAALDALGL